MSSSAWNASYVTPDGAAWLASAGTYPRSTLALWEERPDAPVVLPCGSVFDVVSAPAMFGRRMLDRLWDDGPGSGPVAELRGRMLLFAAPGTAQRLPALLEWEEWGAGGRTRFVPPLLCHGTGDAVTVPAATVSPSPTGPASPSGAPAYAGPASTAASSVPGPLAPPGTPTAPGRAASHAGTASRAGAASGASAASGAGAASADQSGSPAGTGSHDGAVSGAGGVFPGPLASPGTPTAPGPAVSPSGWAPDAEGAFDGVFAEFGAAGRGGARWLVAPDCRQPWLPGPEVLLWAAVRAARGAVRISIFPPSEQGANVYDVSRRR